MPDSSYSVGCRILTSVTLKLFNQKTLCRPILRVLNITIISLVFTFLATSLMNSELKLLLGGFFCCTAIRMYLSEMRLNQIFPFHLLTNLPSPWFGRNHKRTRILILQFITLTLQYTANVNLNDEKYGLLMSSKRTWQDFHIQFKHLFWRQSETIVRTS